MGIETQISSRPRAQCMGGKEGTCAREGWVRVIERVGVPCVGGG